MSKLKVDFSRKYGKLKITRELPVLKLPSGQINRVMECLCDCGTIKSVRLLHLIRGRTVSCGCVIMTKKGLSNTPILKVFRSMIDRCEGKTKDSNSYKGKGITVCDEWKNDHLKFYNWSLENGYKKGLQIDRIDNSKGYSPENCRWVLPKINANNKDNTFFVMYHGERKSLSIVLHDKKITQHYAAIMGRIKRGWDESIAIDTPIKKGNYKRK